MCAGPLGSCGYFGQINRNATTYQLCQPKTLATTTHIEPLNARVHQHEQFQNETKISKFQNYLSLSPQRPADVNEMSTPQRIQLRLPGCLINIQYVTNAKNSTRQ